MNAWFRWRPDAQLAQIVRVALRRGTRLSHYLLSAVGALAVFIAVGLWLQPAWRGQMAAKLMPIVSAAVQNGPARLLAGHPFPEFGPLPPPDHKTDSIIARVSSTESLSNSQPFVLGSLANQFDPRNLPSIAPVAPTVAAAPLVVAAADHRVSIESPQQQLVSSYLARRYRVAQGPVNQLVRTAFDTGHEVGLDPLLLLAVMAIESGFNPYAESGVGAQGLMQVMSKVHSDKFEYFGGTSAALQPRANIKVGALILKDCIARGGSLPGGLRLYVGSTSTNDGGYGAKVLAERSRLQNVLRGKKVPINGPQTPILSASTKLDAARPTAPAPKPVTPAAATTGTRSQDDASSNAKSHGALLAELGA